MTTDGSTADDARRVAATGFALDDVVVLLCERVATAEVFGQLLDDALSAANDVPARLALPQAYELLKLLHTRQSDAALEAMRLRHTALELSHRLEALPRHLNERAGGQT